MADWAAPIVAGMREYHKKHVEYDQAYGLADQLSKVGVNESGQLVPLDAPDADGKKQKLTPLIDPRVIQQITSQFKGKREAAGGALEAISRLGLGVAQRAIAQKMEDPKYETEVVPGVKLPLTANQKANVLMEQENRKAAPAGKQYWEGDEQAPAGYYTPRQIEDIRNRRGTQKSSTEFRQLRTDIDVAKVKTSEKTKELNEFSEAYGFPSVLFDSKTKIYGEGSEVAGKPIPKGYYGFEAINRKTGDIEIRHIGKEEFQTGKNIYKEVKTHRDTIQKLGESVKVSTAKARAMLDWAERNPGAAGAAQVKMKAQADLAELGSVAAGGQPGPSPTPVPELEEE